MARVLAATLGAGVPLAVQAQSCPPGYYYASDGNCYPGPPPSYPPPPYDTAPQNADVVFAKTTRRHPRRKKRTRPEP